MVRVLIIIVVAGLSLATGVLMGTAIEAERQGVQALLRARMCYEFAYENGQLSQAAAGFCDIVSGRKTEDEVARDYFGPEIGTQ